MLWGNLPQRMLGLISPPVIKGSRDAWLALPICPIDSPHLFHFNDILIIYKILSVQASVHASRMLFISAVFQAS